MTPSFYHDENFDRNRPNRNDYNNYDRNDRRNPRNNDRYNDNRNRRDNRNRDDSYNNNYNRRDDRRNDRYDSNSRDNWRNTETGTWDNEPRNKNENKNEDNWGGMWKDESQKNQPAPIGTGSQHNSPNKSLQQNNSNSRLPMDQELNPADNENQNNGENNNDLAFNKLANSLKSNNNTESSGLLSSRDNDDGRVDQNGSAFDVNNNLPPGFNSGKGNGMMAINQMQYKNDRQRDRLQNRDNAFNSRPNYWKGLDIKILSLSIFCRQRKLF